MVDTIRAGRYSEYAGLLLEPADIFHNLIDVRGGYAFYLRHIAESPMVCTNPVRCRQLKRRIAVMVRFVDLVDERRAMISPSGSLAMTHRATGVELGFTRLKLSRNSSPTYRLLRW